LVLDGNKTHNNVDAVKKLLEANIKVITLPPNHTAELQPFDKVLAAPYTASRKRIMNELRSENIDTMDDPYTQRMCTIYAMYEAHGSIATRRNCEKAFARTGLYPRDPSLHA
jgi:hypothetical protein